MYVPFSTRTNFRKQKKMTTPSLGLSSSIIKQGEKDVTLQEQEEIPVQVEDIIEAPGHLTTCDPLFDLFKKVTRYMTAKECFSGLALTCSVAREAVLQNHFLGNQLVVYNYLISWIKK